MKFISAAVICFFGVSDAQRGWEPSKPEPAWGPTEPAWEKAPKWKAPKAAKGWNGGGNGGSNGGYNGGSWGGEKDNGGAWGGEKDNGGSWGGEKDNGGSWGGGGTDYGGSLGGNVLTYGNFGCASDINKPLYWIHDDWKPDGKGNEVIKMHCAVPENGEDYSIVSRPCEDNDHFKWKIIPLKEFGFQIYHVGTGKCLTAGDECNEEDTEDEIFLGPCSDDGGVWAGSSPKIEAAWYVSNLGSINSYYCSYGGSVEGGNFYIRVDKNCDRRRLQENSEEDGKEMECEEVPYIWDLTEGLLEDDYGMFSFCNEVPDRTLSYANGKK